MGSKNKGAENSTLALRFRSVEAAAVSYPPGCPWKSIADRPQPGRLNSETCAIRNHYLSPKRERGHKRKRGHNRGHKRGHKQDRKGGGRESSMQEAETYRAMLSRQVAMDYVLGSHLEVG